MYHVTFSLIQSDNLKFCWNLNDIFLTLTFIVLPLTLPVVFHDPYTAATFIVNEHEQDRSNASSRRENILRSSD